MNTYKTIYFEGLEPIFVAIFTKTFSQTNSGQILTPSHFQLIGLRQKIDEINGELRRNMMEIDRLTNEQRISQLICDELIRLRTVCRRFCCD